MAKPLTWRDNCTPIIRQVLSDTEGEDESVIKKALYEAYPFGPRKHHPYKIWLDEIKAQRGTKKSKAKIVNPDQTNLF